MDLLGSMKEEARLVPSVSSYNVVVEALAKAGEWQRALGMLAEMKREGVRPTEFTYNRCMTGIYTYDSSKICSYPFNSLTTAA